MTEEVTNARQDTTSGNELGDDSQRELSRPETNGAKAKSKGARGRSRATKEGMKGVQNTGRGPEERSYVASYHGEGMRPGCDIYESVRRVLEACHYSIVLAAIVVIKGCGYQLSLFWPSATATLCPGTALLRTVDRTS